MKKLKELRNNLGLSQQALAERFNLSQQSIYKYENGLAEPDIDMLKNFSNFFGVTIDYLVDGSDEKYDLDSSFVPTGYEIELLKDLRKINPETRQYLIELIKHM